MNIRKKNLPIEMLELSKDEMFIIKGGESPDGLLSGIGCGCGCTSGTGCGCSSGIGCGCDSGSGCGCGCNCQEQD